MKYFNLAIVYFLLINISSCAQESRYVAFFRDTDAYELAKAVEKGDLEAVEKLIEQDINLLNVTNPVTGSNVLVLAMQVEQFEVFKRLLELGANPNFINPYTKHSILIDAIRPFGSQFEWRIEPKYVELLLEYGADPNYAIENDFTNEKQWYIMATSPLMEASKLDLNIVKLLVRYGADPYKRLGEKKLTPFGEAVMACKFDIIDYYIDTLGVDVMQPLMVRSRDSLFVQDYIKKFMAYKKGSEGYEKKQELVKKLESRGVDFKNYKYKL
ncbi:ankyrin repeat domain-containing protein [Candidatus Parcubacteria bacterium]|nr:MAG: ankyrin repeat domain-containing protein [Candidatus Parcubacteria bacterium]